MNLLAAACACALVLLASPRATSIRLRQLAAVGSSRLPFRGLGGIAQRIPGNRWARMAHQRRHTRAMDAVAALVAELQVGAPSGVALARAFAEISDLCPRSLAAARFGGDIADGLRADAMSVPALSGLAAVWRVAEDSGSGLANACAALLQGLRDSEELRRTLDAQLAGPRASARMLSALPLVGLLMGLLLGGNPLVWLLATAPGRLCLLGGVLLNVVGILWTRRIAAKAAVEA